MKDQNIHPKLFFFTFPWCIHRLRAIFIMQKASRCRSMFGVNGVWGSLFLTALFGALAKGADGNESFVKFVCSLYSFYLFKEEALGSPGGSHCGEDCVKKLPTKLFISYKVTFPLRIIWFSGDVHLHPALNKMN